VLAKGGRKRNDASEDNQFTDLEHGDAVPVSAFPVSCFSFMSF
jgi:hypothetical protein